MANKSYRQICHSLSLVSVFDVAVEHMEFHRLFKPIVTQPKEPENVVKWKVFKNYPSVYGWEGVCLGVCLSVSVRRKIWILRKFCFISLYWRLPWGTKVVKLVKGMHFSSKNLHLLNFVVFVKSETFLMRCIGQNFSWDFRKAVLGVTTFYWP
jgi:hypothetical protein